MKYSNLEWHYFMGMHPNGILNKGNLWFNFLLHFCTVQVRITTVYILELFFKFWNCFIAIYWGWDVFKSAKLILWKKILLHSICWVNFSCPSWLLLTFYHISSTILWKHFVKAYVNHNLFTSSLNLLKQLYVCFLKIN